MFWRFQWEFEITETQLLAAERIKMGRKCHFFTHTYIEKYNSFETVAAAHPYKARQTVCDKLQSIK